MTKKTLIAFIKNPVLGKVKTRLAATVGEHRALDIYQELCKHTLTEARAISADKKAYYSHFIKRGDAWQEAGFTAHIQEGENLGKRMQQAFSAALVEDHPVVLIGTDCPKITTAMLQTAFDALLNNDVVIGPAEDGGYYLIGMKRYIPELFEGITWSTDTVCKTTIDRAKALDISPSILATLPDVDVEADWKKHGWVF